MSVIVAVKENGVVYMGADTQTTMGKSKINGLNETAFKVTKFENGILVGFCGRVAAKQEILSMKDVFVLDQNGELNKKHIVKEIVPKLVNKMELIGDQDSGSLDISILLAYKDKMYRITVDLDVISLNDYASSGAGMRFTNWCLYSQKHLPAKERVLKALEESAKRVESVGGPYILIDTKKLEYEIVDLGGKNY